MASDAVRSGGDAVDAAVGAGGDVDAAARRRRQRREVAVGEREDLLDAAVGIDAVERGLGLALARARQRRRPTPASRRRGGDLGAARRRPRRRAWSPRAAAARSR